MTKYGNVAALHHGIPLASQSWKANMVYWARRERGHTSLGSDGKLAKLAVLRYNFSYKEHALHSKKGMTRLENPLLIENLKSLCSTWSTAVEHRL